MITCSLSLNCTWCMSTAFILTRAYSVLSVVTSRTFPFVTQPQHPSSSVFRSSPSPPPSLASSSRCLSRAINIALKKRQKKVTLPRTMRLIDEQGANLGVMNSDIATKLAESKNLKLVEVQRSSPDSVAVYRLFTSKQQWEEAKKKKKAAKTDPINTTKEITIFSRIGDHDLAVKMSHLREFLERGNSARVFIQTKYRRGMSEERERESREEMVERIVKEFEGLGEKVSETAHQRRGIACLFRPVRKKL